MYSMHTKGLVSVIIPSRNEPYLKKTIESLLATATGEIEIIVILDGYYPDGSDLVLNNSVNYIHRGKAQGMRGGINSAVAMSHGEYLLKSDAHCMFGLGWDEILKADCEATWVVVPRRYALDPEKWQIEPNPKYPVDYMYLDKTLHGRVWEEKNSDLKLKGKEIDTLMSSQGSCWFMQKDYYDWLELLDEENYGTFFNEFQEIGLKCWLSGGKVMVNKKTWYAHWHKPRDVGRGYNLDRGEQEKAAEYLKNWEQGNGWHKQRISLNKLIADFSPVPTWEGGVLNGN